MSQEQFIFHDYSFDEQSKTLSMVYKVAKYTFTEKIIFDFEFTEYDPEALERTLELTFFMAGVSYYKAFLPEKIAINKGRIDSNLASLLEETYQEGLGEFFYVNGLDPHTKITFPITTPEDLQPLDTGNSGTIVGLGGGKDSLLSVELLRDSGEVATWSVGHKQQLEPLTQAVGLPHYWVERTIDTQIVELKDNPKVYNGHIPISAIFAAIGSVVCVLSGKRDHVVSNESSSNEPTLNYKNKDINHQFSKSHRFEIIFKSYLNHIFGESIRYYSLLRPFTELRIAELFIDQAFEKYKDVFSSCNRAYVQSSDSLYWCGACPKCAFVYLAFSPFINPRTLSELFSGKDLLADPELKDTYNMLLGIDKHKPLECVGTIDENRKAMELTARVRPSLKSRFSFTTDPVYDYRHLASHAIPSDVYDTLQSSLKYMQ